MSDIVLQAKNVSKVFQVSQGLFKGKRDLHAVRNVSLDVEAGSIIGTVGESGCGKTTLARMLLGLEKPTEGEILVNGKNLSEMSQLDIASRVQPIFQDPYSSLNPRKTIGSIISLPLRVHGNGDARERRRRVEEVMERTGLPSRLYRNYPSQLSGGQRQRVAVARALIMRPSIVVCDEPTSALDVSIQAQILNLLQELQKEFGLTYIIISHNLAVIEHMAHAVSVMYLGRVVDESPARDLFADPKHPYSKALLNSVLTPEPDKDVPETNLGSTFPNPLDPPPGCPFHPRCDAATDQCRTIDPSMTAVGGGRVACHLFGEG